MSRKRKKIKNLDHNSKRYWNERLTRAGLSMERGRSNKLLYIGSGSDVEAMEGRRFINSGRTAVPHSDD
jgi:hypothetical protein